MMIYKVIYKAIMASNGTIMYLLFHNVFINDSRPNVSGKVSYVSELMQSLTFSIIVVILSNAKNLAFFVILEDTSLRAFI